MEEYLSTELPALIDLLQESDALELELDEGDLHLRIRRAPQPMAALTEDGEVQGLRVESPRSNEILSPLVGTFYRAATPDKPPLVSEGSVVDEDTVVGIVEALNHLTEVEAGCAGIVTQTRAHDGQPVEYGQVLFVVTPRD